MESSEFVKTLFSLDGRTALVTGGGSGIGRIIAEALSKFGANIIITSRNKETGEKTQSEILASKPKGFVDYKVLDISSENKIKSFVSEVEKTYGFINMLVNNSGRSWGSELEKFPYSAWDKILSVNLTGLFHLTQSLLPMLEKGATIEMPSKILNIGSVMGSKPYGDGAYSYAASKAAVHHITKILAKELAPKHITVNAFAPGPFASKMTNFAINTPKKLDAVTRGVPMGRIGRYEDIAAATIFLAGRGGNYITGAIIPIDGGIHVSTGPELFAESRDL